MKKYLAILALAALISAPAFAQCNTCLPRVQMVQVPVMQQCAPACNPCATCNPCITGAACPVCDPCNPCNTCINCCPPKKGFWSRFFGY